MHEPRRDVSRKGETVTGTRGAALAKSSSGTVVTNLVAVLIIMVTVVGVRGKDALLDAAPAAVRMVKAIIACGN